MSNKDLKKIYYFNKEKNYQKILKLIESNQTKNKYNIFKIIVIPISLIIILFGIIYLNKNDNEILKSNQIINKGHDFELYINTIDTNRNFTTSNGESKFDADIQRMDIKIEELKSEMNYKFLNNLILPNDLTDNTYNGIYIKKNKYSNTYTVLHNYDFWYQNIENKRRIILSFSDKYQPLRDYFFNNNGKVSKINNTEIIIYQYNNSYMTTFTYDNINFDIETNNITQEEFIDLLMSIIK